MKSVWVVMEYNWSDTSIKGIFTSKKRAQAYVEDCMERRSTSAPLTLEKFALDRRTLGPED